MQFCVQTHFVIPYIVEVFMGNIEIWILIKFNEIPYFYDLIKHFARKLNHHLLIFCRPFHHSVQVNGHHKKVTRLLCFL
jgi:hypothetical protein